MADNISALVQDGVIQTTTASSLSLSSTTDSSSSSLDKDAFLQLLVTQMKYQDPLEPTDNTEYISQLATFSELEEMQNLSASMDLQRASALVGKEVMLNVTNSSTGNTELVSGTIDYVVYENNKAYVAINDNLYSIDDISEIVDSDYSYAYSLAKQFTSALADFPSTNSLTLDYADALSSLRNTYDSMTSYQKSFISDDTVSLLESLEAKMSELNLAAQSENA